MKGKAPVLLREPVSSSRSRGPTDSGKNKIAQKVIAECGDSVAYNTVAILGLSFKQNTDDGREAVAISIVIALQSTWAKGQVYDPQAIEQGR